MRRLNWRYPCRRAKVSVSWMCMALWCMMGIQFLTTSCIKCRWAENSEEDLSSTRGRSSQAWKWVHTVSYPKHIWQGILLPTFYTAENQALKDMVDKRDAEQKRKEGECANDKRIEANLTLTLQYTHYSSLVPTLIYHPPSLCLHQQLYTCAYTTTFTLCCIFNHWKLICLLVCNTCMKSKRVHIL